MSADPDNPSAMIRSIGSAEATVLSSGNQLLYKETGKKKRNLPGMPDPDAEVIALSPKTLMATNRFVCEVCNKGFQRDQNLQLHRRGHNLPWKLRQRSSKEVKKRVYVCPEPTCVHHDPSRALGDLTGIKKHFCRKHGEKKWKCDKCTKNYAVQSDLKAHVKICGTKEYKCDCGTMFSRKDSFITHRAFCDVLAKDGEKEQVAGTAVSADVEPKVEVVASPPPPPPLTPPAPPPVTVLPPEVSEPLPPPVSPLTAVTSPDSPVHNSELRESPHANSTGTMPKQLEEETGLVANLSGICRSTSSSNNSTNGNSFSRMTGICSSSSTSCSNGSTSSSSIFARLTGISGTSSSNGSTSCSSISSIFASPTGIFSSSSTSCSNRSTISHGILSLGGISNRCSTSSSNGSTTSSSIFANPAGICRSGSTLYINGSTSNSNSIFVSPTGICSSGSTLCSDGSTISSSTFASLFASPSQASPQFTDWFQSMPPEPPPVTVEQPSSMEPVSLCLAMNHSSSIFGGQETTRRQYALATQPSMSATALLQKAAQMGATTTNSSLLRGLGILSSSSPSNNGQHEWSAGLGLGLPCDDGSGLKELMLGTPSVFGPKHPTLDLLGLGMAAGGGPTPRFSALRTSMGGNIDVGAAAGSFGGGEFCGEDLGRSS